MITPQYAFSQAIVPTNNPTTLELLVRFRAEVQQKPRRRLNLSLVIDRSGSMSGGPLRHALQAAQAVVDLLQAGDTLSVVVFDDKVDTIIAPYPISDKAADKTALKEKIRKVSSGGLTNLSGGWIEGCKHVKAHFDPQKINRVLLLTDGQPNVGISDPKVLIKTAAQKLEEGIVTTTLGFGNGFNEDLLIGMARAASGNFYYIQSTDEAAEVFQIELEGMKSVVAQNLSVILALEPGVVLKNVLSLTQASTQANIQANNLLLGDIYEGEDKVLGLTLELPEYSSGGHSKVLSLGFTVDTIENDVIVQQTGALEVTVQAGTLDEVISAADTGVGVEIARLRIARAKEGALEHNEAGKTAQAEALLRDLMVDLRSKGLHENFEIAEELEQLEYFANRIAKKNLGGEGRKELRDQSFQGLSRNRADLAGRGLEGGDEVRALPKVEDADGGVELVCLRQGGKLRVKAVGDPFDPKVNVQFPRAIRAEGVRYRVDGLESSVDGSFYRVIGKISRLLRPGESDTFSAPTRSGPRSSGKAATGPASAADLPTTDTVGTGVLVQCVKDGSKLRARVVSDGYDPNFNMRFPRSVREDGMLYVVDDVQTGPDGKSYIACGTVKRFVQTT
jgi:Ca-activated chloride channel homolog